MTCRGPGSETGRVDARSLVAGESTSCRVWKQPRQATAGHFHAAGILKPEFQSLSNDYERLVVCREPAKASAMHPLRDPRSATLLGMVRSWKGWFQTQKHHDRPSMPLKAGPPHACYMYPRRTATRWGTNAESGQDPHDAIWRQESVINEPLPFTIIDIRGM